MTPAEILDLPMQDNDAGAATIRGYLLRLLSDVWRHREGFNGKRPFGNSGWNWELHEALGRAGAIDITFDEDGYIEDCDSKAGDQLIAAAIQALGSANQERAA